MQAQIFGKFFLDECVVFFFLNNIYFWLHWVFAAACGLSLVAASRGYSSLQCTGFSLRWLLLLWSTGFRHAGFSSCGLWALEHRLSSCGAQAQLLCGTWDLPGPGLEPVSPALAGGFLTTAPPGKSRMCSFDNRVSMNSSENCKHKDIPGPSCLNYRSMKEPRANYCLQLLQKNYDSRC